MDTRHHRSDIRQQNVKRTMLGDKQAAALHAWLGRVSTPHNIGMDTPYLPKRIDEPYRNVQVYRLLGPIHFTLAA